MISNIFLILPIFHNNSLQFIDFKGCASLHRCTVAFLLIHALVGSRKCSFRFSGDKGKKVGNIFKEGASGHKITVFALKCSVHLAFIGRKIFFDTITLSLIH